MPSIYKKLKSSDRKFIRKEKSRIRREFLGFKKQEELISELYKKMLGESKVNKDDKNGGLKEKLHPVKSAKSGVSSEMKQFNRARKTKLEKTKKVKSVK